MTVYEEIQVAIDFAWATTDPETKQRQLELVGDSHKPTPEELVFLISQKVKSRLTRQSGVCPQG